ncbi:MAG: bifunctional demethylmenaquinone methyltransferase/2-methoxy-6-polyprenyl-1,4-benzoquinol methylase UbiE [Tannerellaceae bacterium]|jgi:demethylmenaquinone methyltransferase/2-methoxy-6-polyprenyl-1,4-benzoquinol methylase|nr:bifunctional demethylmenaquinone methyltransferase/2-methoxy-6-polyprenyl-1,4-benzoquinol methylase UbiE [Tannerellaceae bacterium]
MTGAEKILPYNEAGHKGAQVRRMFDGIAGTYDTLNHKLSLGIDRRWRAKAIDCLLPYAPRNVLDVATGTGDLAIAMCEALRPVQITAVDISEGMMAVGRIKASNAGCSDTISFEYGDCLSLPYADGSFDAVTSAFGVRNFENIEDGMAEMYRVMKPGGHLVVLELSHPRQFPVRQLYGIYSKAIIPRVGRLLSKDAAAYNYLPASVKAVPQGEVMAGMLGRQGFINVEVQTFTLGICSLYRGEKTK